MLLSGSALFSNISPRLMLLWQPWHYAFPSAFLWHSRIPSPWMWNGLGMRLVAARLVVARDRNKVVNFKLSMPRAFALYSPIAHAMQECPVQWASSASFMHCWKDGWCRLKEFSEILAFKFRVAVHLPHSTVNRHYCGVWLKTTTPWVIL